MSAQVKLIVLFFVVAVMMLAWGLSFPGQGLPEMKVEKTRAEARPSSARGGIMEAVSRGASEAGGHVIGYTAPEVFSGRVGANEFVVEEVAAATLTGRIHAMLERAEQWID